MRTLQTLRPGLAITVLLLLPLAGLNAGCGSDDDGSDPTGPGATATVTAAEFADFAASNADLGLRLGEAMTRTLAALSGETADGVSFTTQDGQTYTGAIALDLDGDGNRETTLTGAAAFVQLFDKDGEFAPVAELSLDGVDSPILRSASGTLEAEMLGAGEFGAPMIYLHSADLALTTADGVGAACTDMHMTIDAGMTGGVGGYGGTFSFTAGGLDLSCSFVPTEMGWAAHITGDGVDEMIMP
jgi:hypothetical protein